MSNSSKFVPYSSHISPKIVKIKGGDYCMAFSVGGVPYTGVIQELVDARINQFNKLICSFKEPTRWNIYVHSYIVKANAYPELLGDFDNKFSKNLDQEYTTKKINSKDINQTTCYLVLVYRPFTALERRTINFHNRTFFLKHEENAKEVLSNLENHILMSMQEYDIKTLSTYKEKNVMFSEVLEFFGFLVNGFYKKVPVLKAQISEYLATSNLIEGDSEVLLIEDSPNKIYSAFLSISEYPNEVRGGAIRSCLELGYRMIVSQVFLPIDKKDATDWLKKNQRLMIGSDDASVTEIKEIDAALDGVQSDQFVLGEYGFLVQLQADTIEDLKKAIGKTKSELANDGFIAVEITRCKLSAFYSQLPSNIKYLPRKAKLSSENATQILPFHIQNTGKKTNNPWGEAVAILKTKNNQPYFFNFHDSPKNKKSKGKLFLGNTLIVGMAGAGKTVLLSFLLAQATRYSPSPKLVVFDKDLGSSVFIRAMGGEYSRIRLGQPTGFNPFKIGNDANAFSFVCLLIKELIAQPDTPLTAKEEEKIAENVRLTLDYSKKYQNLSAFRNLLLEGNKKNPAFARLNKWVGDGEYAWVFDNEEDTFSLSNNNKFGIDYTEFLDHSEIRSPILMYLFERIEMILDGSPVIVSMDEAWKPFADPTCAKFIENKQRTIRKEGGIGVYATQSPEDFLRGISSVFLEQIATAIYLPNPLAKNKDYVDGFGLTLEEFEIVKNLGTFSREFLVKQGGSSTVCKLDLEGMTQVDVLSGSEERGLLAEKLQEQHPKNWLKEYSKIIKRRSYV